MTSPTERNRWVLQDLPQQERPRERLLQVGAERLATRELLAIVLRTGMQGVSSLELADRLLAHFEHLRGLQAAGVEELAQMPGMGPAKAAQLKAALELARRLNREGRTSPPAIRCPEDVAALVMDDMRLLEKEEFRALLLDTKHRVIQIAHISVGDLNSTPVHPRELFKEAIRRSAAALVLVHNHPSGNPEPSAADVALTRRLWEAGRLLGIEVLDHVIIGDTRHVSMKELGVFQGFCAV